jgi:hypothetical protein
MTWQAQERARRALLTPETWWRNRRTGLRVEIMGVQGIRVKYRARKSRRCPSGIAEIDIAPFLMTYTPVSQE